MTSTLRCLETASAARKRSARQDAGSLGGAGMPNDGEIVDLLPFCAPDPARRQKLLVENPARLFKFT
jgi:hypothetical protein